MNRIGRNRKLNSLQCAFVACRVAQGGRYSILQTQSRHNHNESFERFSKLFVPTGGIESIQGDGEGHDNLLVRAGLLRKAHAGAFHLLPLGLRIQEKIEKLVDKHMQNLGANKVSLSSITSEALWKQSGRLSKTNTELYKLSDGEATGLLLSPTHEEEITTLVSQSVNSYKQLPLRLYQISRKYRNERRPRHGLLRTREFLMKDLYTFDVDDAAALETYQKVRAAYNDFFDDLKIPYVVAEADSGQMGGNLSHEFHFPASFGEDTLFKCNECSYVANEELAKAALDPLESNEQGMENVAAWFGQSQDKQGLVIAFYPLSKSPNSGDSNTRNENTIRKIEEQILNQVDAEIQPPNDINYFAVKRIVPEADLTVKTEGMPWSDEIFKGIKTDITTVTALADYRLSTRQKRVIFDSIHTEAFGSGRQHPVTTRYVEVDEKTETPLDLVKIEHGDRCPSCNTGSLYSQTAVELGHTFHLGTRYSEPFSATVSSKEGKLVPLSMGCHGIGVSRLIGTIAAGLADEKGLNWPRAICPYEVAVLYKQNLHDKAASIANKLMTDARPSDLVLDDRDRSLGWKLQDADLIGYPIIVIVGKAFEENNKCEVQCRRLDDFREKVTVEELPALVRGLLDRL